MHRIHMPSQRSYLTDERYRFFQLLAVRYSCTLLSILVQYNHQADLRA